MLTLFFSGWWAYWWFYYFLMDFFPDVIQWLRNFITENKAKSFTVYILKQGSALGLPVWVWGWHQPWLLSPGCWKAQRGTLGGGYVSLLISTELGSRSLFSPFVRDSCNTESCQFLFLLFHTTQTLNSLDRLSPCGLQTTKRGGVRGGVSEAAAPVLTATCWPLRAQQAPIHGPGNFFWSHQKWSYWEKAKEEKKSLTWVSL